MYRHHFLVEIRNRNGIRDQSGGVCRRFQEQWRGRGRCPNSDVFTLTSLAIDLLPQRYERVGPSGCDLVRSGLRPCEEQARQYHQQVRQRKASQPSVLHSYSHHNLLLAPGY